jgi:quercetin dioxygenase-like cupin family protein
MKLEQHLLAHQDNRGQIFDVLQNVEISAISLISFNENAIRGNHFHLKTTQWNYVLSGEIEFSISFNGEISSGLISTGDLLRIDPGEEHAFKATNFAKMFVFTLGPRGGKDFESDTFRLNKSLII